MNELFDQEWFIQTLVAYILKNYEELYEDHCIGKIIDHKKHILVLTIFQINQKCYYFGISQSKFLLVAHTNNYSRNPFNKKYYTKTFQELQEILPNIILENDIDTGYWWVVFSAYRIFTNINGFEIPIRAYFEDIDL